MLYLAAKRPRAPVLDRCARSLDATFDNMGVSTMSDYDRNIAAAPFGQTTSRAGSVAVDEGLRAYMLRIYNYMVLGLAITGAAALGTYMLSVTTDPTVAEIGKRRVGKECRSRWSPYH